jgi:hypothetical protein
VDARSPTSIARRFRRRRWELFLELCRPDPAALLLDVGGQPDDSLASFWAGPVIRVNRQRFRPRRPGDRAVVADARALPFRDAAFPVLFCNSVLEHVGPWEDQQQAANEIQRVGKRYFVQVPDRHTPIEPHYLLPFFQYLSEPWQRAVHRWFPISSVPRDGFYRVWLLTANQLRRLFPDARVVRERVLGFPKSCYAVRDFRDRGLVHQ